MTIEAGMFEAIESLRYSARVNLASNVKTFIRLVLNQPEYISLSAAVVDRSDRVQVVDRIRFLASQPYERMHENPHDSAVASYAQLLCYKDEDMARETISAILHQDGWWWTLKVLQINEFFGAGPTG